MVRCESCYNPSRERRKLTICELRETRICELPETQARNQCVASCVWPTQRSKIVLDASTLLDSTSSGIDLGGRVDAHDRVHDGCGVWTWVTGCSVRRERNRRRRPCGTREGGALCAAVHSCLWPLEVRNSACDCDHDVLECLTRGDVAIVPRGLAQQWLLPPHLPLQWFPPRPQTR